jgi:RHS repeat-associated protein
LDFKLGFPGQYCDDESQLCYNWWRSYRPVDARYMQADRIGLDGGRNRFVYVGGNPMSLIDPDGFQPITPSTPVPRLPLRVEMHNRLNDSDSQFRREFGRDAFPDPSTPVQGLVNNEPWCHLVCDTKDRCLAPPPLSISKGDGCYEVCTPGPFASDDNPLPSMSPVPHERTASVGEWLRLLGILRGK